MPLKNQSTNYQINDLKNQLFLYISINKDKEYKELVIKKKSEKELDIILKELIELLDSKKAENIRAIDVGEITTIAKYIIIVTANSTVHANTLAKYTTDFLHENKIESFNRKKIDLNNPWILIDTSEIIVNIFDSETRDFYSLEKIFFKGKTIETDEIIKKSPVSKS